MEHFEPGRLSDFIEYARLNDLQILVNRRVARELFDAALEDDGDFAFPIEKVEKIQTFLTLPEVYSQGNSVQVYAFVRLMGDLRRSLRRYSTSTAPSRAASEPVPGG